MCVSSRNCQCFVQGYPFLFAVNGRFFPDDQMKRVMAVASKFPDKVKKDGMNSNSSGSSDDSGMDYSANEKLKSRSRSKSKSSYKSKSQIKIGKHDVSQSLEKVKHEEKGKGKDKEKSKSKSKEKDKHRHKHKKDRIKSKHKSKKRNSSSLDDNEDVNKADDSNLLSMLFTLTRYVLHLLSCNISTKCARMVSNFFFYV